MAPYRVTLRYYRCNTPYRARPFQGGEHPPKMVQYPPPPSYLVSQPHLFDKPSCNVSRDKNKHKEFCDTIAGSIVRYEKYRWASKTVTAWGVLPRAYTLEREEPHLRPGGSERWSTCRLLNIAVLKMPLTFDRFVRTSNGTYLDGQKRAF